MNFIINYDWPGNVRQLQNLVERAYNIGFETMLLPEDSILQQDTQLDSPADRLEGNISVSVQQYERELIENLISQKDNNISSVAKALGVARSTVYRKMLRYGIPR